ncbi:MAG: sulfatase [Planctomycetota bacterium]
MPSLAILAPFAVVGVLLDPAGAAANERRPNIVFLMADDQCAYSVGCYGSPDALTPNLDQLARDGIAFDNHYDTTAICMASRASVVTGLYEYRHGCNFEHGPLLREHWRQSYPMLLRENGYLTAMAGKIGFVVADGVGVKGKLPEEDFDRWGAGPGQTHYETIKNPSIAQYAEEFPHSTLAYGAFARDFIRDAASDDRPFCLSISFKAPHRPDTPDPRFDDVYVGKAFAKPANFGREKGTHFAPQSRQGRQYRRFTEWLYDRDYDGVMTRYHQQVYAIDVAVGMIREALDGAGVERETVIIYTSDNGFLCGSHGYGSKVLPYEESSRVPLIIVDPRLPGDQSGTRRTALTGNVDIAPTICELAGVSVPDNLDGRSLLPACRDDDAAGHDALPLINVWGPPAVHSLAMATKDWKYVYWGYDDGFDPREELYHTAKDQGELRNLADEPEYLQELQKMRALYDAQVAAWKDTAVPYHRYGKFAAAFQRRLVRGGGSSPQPE